MSDPADPIIIGRPGLGELVHESLRPSRTPHRWYLPLLALSGLGCLLFLAAIVHTLMTGIGAWGNRNPTNWGFAITNFVWWIGIGHAGTFISAIALLLNQGWRTSINRIAETMTLLALINAGLYPLLHLGRAWFFYWLAPYPSTMEIWPQFRSSLTWDVAAISTYSLVSFLFWYVGMIPDLATLRDRLVNGWPRRLFGFFALGWRGTHTQWRHQQAAYRLLAGLATPLVISVHSVVSLDFAIAKVPGWNSTIFPPYFVAGALVSGFAMVLMLVIPLRRLIGWQRVITPRHFDALSSVLLVTALIVSYAYLIETFLAWWSGDGFLMHQVLIHRPFGSDAWLFWSVVAGNVLIPQLLWFRRIRRSAVALFLVSCCIQWAMWAERYILVITTLENDFVPAVWDEYLPSLTDLALFAGSLSLFVFGMLLALRWLPLIPITEMREAVIDEGHDSDQREEQRS